MLKGENLQSAKVIGRHTNRDGSVKGSFNENPILDTRVYDVMFPDGSIQSYAANVIAENMWSQVDDEGYRYKLMDCILDHHTNGTEVTKADGFVISKNGKRTHKTTTKGWFLNVQWKDGTTSWKPLKL